MTELVSIIIPCFNAEAWVRRAIESALSQSYPHREVIVIDDGSTDSSVDILRSFGSVIRWESGPNCGGCHARNRGLELSQGELVQFLDSDDFLHPEKLQKQVSLAAQYDDAIVYCDHHVVSTDGASTTRSCGVNWSDPIEFVLEHTGLTTIGPLHRRRWLESVGGFRNGLRAAQELDLHLRLAASGLRFVHLAEPLFTVRRQTASVSSNSTKTLEQWIIFFPDLVENLKKNGLLTNYRRQFMAKHVATAARQVLREGNRQNGEKLVALAGELDPKSAGLAYGRLTRILKTLVGPYHLEQLGRHIRATTAK